MPTCRHDRVAWIAGPVWRGVGTPPYGPGRKHGVGAAFMAARAGPRFPPSAVGRTDKPGRAACKAARPGPFFIQTTKNSFSCSIYRQNTKIPQSSAGEKAFFVSISQPPLRPRCMIRTSVSPEDCWS